MDAEESLHEAEAGCRESCRIQLYALIKRLADRGELRVPDQFVSEGNGIWAIKTRCGLRAYGWYHSRKRGVFVISHYINKKRQKMRRSDLERIERNRKSYETGGK